MMPFDYDTLLVIAGFMYWLVPLLCWLTLGRPTDIQAKLWLVGGILSGTGLVLMGYRGEMYEIISYVVAPMLMVSGPLMLAQALRMYVNNGWPWLLFGLGGVAYSGLLLVLLWQDAFYVISVLVRAVNFMALITVSLAAWSLYRYEKSINALVICLTFGFLALGVWLNVMSAAMGHSDIRQPELQSFAPVAIFASALAALLAYMAYLSMELERSLRADMSLRIMRKRTEFLRKRSQMLAVLDRQQTLGVLADSLGHSMTQPLAATQLSIDLLHRKFESISPDAASIEKLLMNVVMGIQNCSEKVNQIREFIRPSQTNKKQLDMKDVIQDSYNLIHQELTNRGIEWILKVPSEPVEVLADRMQLTHAVMHVLRNAMTALENHPYPKIELHLTRNDRRMTLKIRDNGAGFSANYLTEHQGGHILAKTSSASLGLPMVQGIVEQFSGNLSIMNAEQGGAQVVLVLPVAR